MKHDFRFPSLLGRKRGVVNEWMRCNERLGFSDRSHLLYVVRYQPHEMFMQPWCGYDELIVLNPSRVVLRLCSNSVQVFEPFVSILIGKNSQ